MQQTTTKQNTFGTLVLEQVWSRLGKNYRYLGNKYYQLPNNLREYIPDYYPFGSTLPTRSWSDASRAYRYGFNGKEKDSETANDAYDFGARIYDGRLGRWMSLDPLMKKYAELTPYNYCLNSPTTIIDFNGKDVIISNLGNMQKGASQILANSKIISSFIVQFASNNEGSGTQYFYNHLTNKSDGIYSNNVDLNFNVVPRTSGIGTTLISTGQDASTSISYTLVSGATINASTYNPFINGPVASVDISINILAYSPDASQSNGNNQAIASTYTAVAITQELFSTVSLIISNTNTNGTINYTNLTNSLLSLPIQPTVPNIGIPRTAMQDLVNTNMVASSTPYIQNDVAISANSNCLITFPAGMILSNDIQSNTANIGLAYDCPAPLATPGINPSTVTPTPDNQRNANPSSSEKCF